MAWEDVAPGQARQPERRQRRDRDRLLRRTAAPLTRRHERALVAAGLVDTYNGGLEDPVDVHSAILTAIDPELFGKPDQPGSERVTDDDDVFLDSVKRFSQFRMVLAAVHLPEPSGRTPGGRDGQMLRLHVVQVEDLPPSPTVDDAPGLIHRHTSPRIDDAVIRLRLDQVDACESFHLEVVAPAGVMIREGRMGVRRSVTEDAGAELIAAARAEMDLRKRSDMLSQLTPTWEGIDDDPHAERMHVYYGRPQDGTVFLGAEAIAVFRPLTAGTLRPGLYVSYLCSAVLLLLWFTIGWAGAPPWAWQFGNVRYRPEADALVAAILLGPTLVAGLVVRADEHLLTKRIVFRHRIRMAAQASTCFAAATLYAAGVPADGRWWMLGWLAVASSICTGLTRRSYVVSNKSLVDRVKPTDEMR